jgi:hypothetical protein
MAARDMRYDVAAGGKADSFNEVGNGWKARNKAVAAS